MFVCIKTTFTILRSKGHQKDINSWTCKETLHSHGPISIQIHLWKPSYFHLETASLHTITHHQTTIWLTVYVHTPMPYLQNWKGSKNWDHNCDSVSKHFGTQKECKFPFGNWMDQHSLSPMESIVDSRCSPWNCFIPWDFLGFKIKSIKQLTQIIHIRLQIDESKTEETSLRQRETSPAWAYWLTNATRTTGCSSLQMTVESNNYYDCDCQS